MTTARQPADLKGLRIAPLDDPKCLDGFSCGESEIDRNVEKCCNWHQFHSRRVFCAFLGADGSACGFYCVGISASDSKYIDKEILSTDNTQSYVPFIYINYLAVSSDFQNNGIGTMLLMNALERCAYVIKNIGVPGVALNALTDRAAGLYDRYGFREHGQGKFPFMVLPALSVLDLFS